MSFDANALVSTLGWALLHFVWQGALIGLAAAIALTALRNARPQTRYAIACFALALCVAIPAVQVWRGLRQQELPSAIPALAANASVALQFDAVKLDALRPALQDRLSWIVVAWSLGVGLLTLRMLIGLAWIGRISREPGLPVDRLWQLRFDRLVERFGLWRDVGLRLCDRIESPITAGWWRPVVIVPSALIARLSPELLEALIAHELAHIRRHDYLVNLMQSAVEALLFYHPVVWWLSRRIRDEREQIADDLAARALGEPRRLALALQELDRFQFSHSSLAPAAHGGNLMTRIQRLIRPSSQAFSWKTVLPVLGLAAVCLTVYAQNRPAPIAAAEPVATIAPLDAASPMDAVALVASVDAVSAIAPAPAIGAIASVLGSSSDDADEGKDENGYRPKQSYALVRDGHESITVSSERKDRVDVEHAMRLVDGDFIWFRQDGRAYVIQEPTLIARAVSAWEPTEALSEKMEALSKQMEPHSRAMEALSEKMEAISDRGQPNSREMERLGREMEALGRQQEALSRKLEPLAQDMSRVDGAIEREAIAKKMEALHVQMDQLHQKMEPLSQAIEKQSRELEAAHAPMEALGREMEEASKPMSEIGRRLGELGKQQEKLSHAADSEVRGLIEQALRSGKAKPVDSAR